jgi:hypothetical protein
MNIRKTVVAAGLGSILIIGTAGFAAAAPQEFWQRGAARQEQNARAEIRRGEALERQGHFLESRGDYRRGEMLERRGEALKRHGRQMLAAAERREHFGNAWR